MCGGVGARGSRARARLVLERCRASGLAPGKRQQASAVLVQPVLQMVSSDFAGGKEDAATLRREGRVFFPIPVLLVGCEYRFAPSSRRGLGKNPSSIRHHL